MYAKVGGNASFSVTPPVMHFGGYEVNRVHKQRFVVTNLTNASKRLHVVVPTTPHFKCTFEKRGLMAPGMSEVITVEFCPTEVRYYYDCVRIHNEDENLLVPVHAYPVMNEAGRGHGDTWGRGHSFFTFQFTAFVQPAHVSIFPSSRVSEGLPLSLSLENK